MLCQRKLIKRLNYKPHMLKDFQPRLYQETIFHTAVKFNTLVVLPTGMGKTGLALMLAAQRLHLYPDSKILILAPTKPLCEQHTETFQKHLDIEKEKIALLTGQISPLKRAELWQNSQIICSTPQGLENDIINRTINFSQVSLLVFDESHHATGDYSYVWLTKQYQQQAKYPRILALTASPGSDLEKIKEVCQNLLIEKVEVRTPKDKDIKPYIQSVEYEYIQVELPEEFKKIQKYLNDCFKSKIDEAKKHGYLRSQYLNKTELLRVQAQLHASIASGDRDFLILKTISLLAEALKVQHALELLESQGLPQLYKYLSGLQQEAPYSKVKAVQNLVIDPNFKAALVLTEELKDKEIKHPKLEKLSVLITEELEKSPSAKIIIFTQFRDSAVEVQKRLENFSSKLFVGQAKKGETGLSQKEQKQILDNFRLGQFSILISTSVGEEGLDIPQVDSVIFYEPVPSAIRWIQRRGRTGRLAGGKLKVLITGDTRDVGYRWSAYHKEKRMHKVLEQIKKEMGSLNLKTSSPHSSSLSSSSPSIPFLPPPPAVKETGVEPAAIQTHGQFPFSSFVASNSSSVSSKTVLILADHREKNNRLVKELIDQGVNVRLEQLKSADYLLSGKTAVELKTPEDFINSLIDGRLLEQAKELKRNFEKSVLIIMGTDNIYALRQVHPHAIQGALAAIMLGYNIPIFQTKDSGETASLLAVMARREQEKDTSFSLHFQKPESFEQQKEFAVSALPGIGPVTAKDLLAGFGSIKKIVNASEEELKQVPGVGEKTAKRLKDFFEEDYKK